MSKGMHSVGDNLLIPWLTQENVAPRIQCLKLMKGKSSGETALPTPSDTQHSLSQKPRRVRESMTEHD